MEKTKITNRIQKATGQLQGIKKMIEEEKNCTDVITQFKATKSAIESAMSLYLENYAKQCLEKRDTKNIETILKELTKK